GQTAVGWPRPSLLKESTRETALPQKRGGGVGPGRLRGARRPGPGPGASENRPRAEAAWHGRQGAGEGGPTHAGHPAGVLEGNGLEPGNAQAQGGTAVLLVRGPRGRRLDVRGGSLGQRRLPVAAVPAGGQTARGQIPFGGPPFELAGSQPRHGP